MNKLKETIILFMFPPKKLFMFPPNLLLGSGSNSSNSDNMIKFIIYQLTFEFLTWYILYSFRFNIGDVLERVFCFNLHEVLRF